MFSSPAVRRVLIGSAMLLFVAAIVAPVVSAMSLCAMPCCHHAAPAGGAIKAEFPCPMKSCAITKASDDVAVVVAPHPVPVVAQATTVVASSEAAPAAQPVVIAGEAPKSSPPLHLINSVFLI